MKKVCVIYMYMYGSLFCNWPDPNNDDDDDVERVQGIIFSYPPPPLLPRPLYKVF